MSGVFSWITRTISGTGEEESEQNTSGSSETSVEDKSKTKGTKTQQKKKKPASPVFHTSLTTPIEEIIEETLREEAKTELTQSSPSRKKRRFKNKENIQENETISDTTKPGSVHQPIESERVLKDSTSSKVNEDEDAEPSFVTVQWRGKKGKNTIAKKATKETLSTGDHTQTKTKEALTKSASAIDHQKSPNKPIVPVASNISLETVTNKPGERQLLANEHLSKYKDSKKVSSNISYSNIVKNDIASERKDENIKLDTDKTANKPKAGLPKLFDLDRIEVEDTFKPLVIPFATPPSERARGEGGPRTIEELHKELEGKITELRPLDSSYFDDPLSKASIFDSIEIIDEPSSSESIDYQVNRSEISETKNVQLQTSSNASASNQFSPDSLQSPTGSVKRKFLDKSPQKNIKHTKTAPEETVAANIVDTSSKGLKMSNNQQVRILTLNDQEHQECTVYRLEKNWEIQFRLGPSLFGRKVYLYCNYPVESIEFNRDRYQLLIWKLDEGCKNADDTAAYTQISAKLAGSFHYFFTYESGENAERQGSGFFLIDPTLTYGNNENLPLDCIQCQTVLSKSLGSFSTWEKKLQVAKESGYNMIHFTPIQELGLSNSSYCLNEQLKVNPIFKKETGGIPTFDEIEQFIGKIRKEWKVTSICDIVLNHTANESQWLKEHPEATYNCANCTYMRSAYLLDAAFYQFSLDVKRGFYEDRGIPKEVNNEDHLQAIRYHFPLSVLEPLKLHELYTCDVNRLVAEFLISARATPPTAGGTGNTDIKIIQDPEYRRLSGRVDMSVALEVYNIYRNNTFDEESRLKRSAELFKEKLDSLNREIEETIKDHLHAAVENVIAGIRYCRVQADGPKMKEISLKNPLVYRYFTDYGTPKSIKEHEDIMYSSNGRYLMAHNGWVMNSDPLRNFAAPDSNVYIRRELIAWGDSVKLRFGDKPADCPFLWNFMKQYVEKTAKIFDGVRLDNCHSTPLPVAEYLLDCARRIRPNIYVVAELFTNSDMTDNIFVNRLGITSLIREAMSAYNSHEEGRLVYRYGGYPVGSFYQPSIRPLVPYVAHALFLDLTHDNPSPVEKRSVFDLLPSTALVNMACCASGSTRGYDELVPHHVHVVDETRQYSEWTLDEKLAAANPKYVSSTSGIISVKKAINDLHFILGKEGFNQVYVDQMDQDIVAVTRHHPDTHEKYILIAFTAFGHPGENEEHTQRNIKPLILEGVLDEIVLEATLGNVDNAGGSKYAKWDKFVQDSKWINGLSQYQVTMQQHIPVSQSNMCQIDSTGPTNITRLNFCNFTPGSIIIVKVSLFKAMTDAVMTVRNLFDTFSLTKETELSRIINDMTLADLNRAIYRCEQEERDEGFGYGVYNIPNFGPMVYAGLQGFMSLWASIRPTNDLGHPMCANLRDGNWMIEYIWKRLQLDEGTKELGKWIEVNTKCFNEIPRYLVPSYFDVVLTGIYVLLMEQCYKLMSDFANHGSTFVKGLSLGSVQFAAYIKSADLPILSPNLSPPKPPTRKNEKGEVIQTCVSISAGLPHFAVGYMRNWGRDTFITLRGLYILTGRYEEARQHILGYAACLRHGLVPNLLDGGRNPRFNCRDAVWWWLYCIKTYTEEAPNGLKILDDKVSRIFPTDDSPATAPGVVDQPLHKVMQEALQVHFQGLVFKERNAGRQIDEHMNEKGFNNQIGVHPDTGFVFGGNEWNCGTWMDKMGSSDKASNRGKPATPRDGSAVEIVGLCKGVVAWLEKLSKEKKYPYTGVERTHTNGKITTWTFKEWDDKIKDNFEQYFWIDTTPVSDESSLINRRGIYKDCYGASQNWADFQLRCNFPIAMVAAPELFSPDRAWTALKQAENLLLGPLGMKTLDPSDMSYRGYYDNSNDSADSTVANGFNYHQGPEWVWPVGYFLRAKLHFAGLNGTLKETVASTKVVLSKHFTELQTSPWRGLPELTNKNGAYCNDSSRTQAWSMACILETHFYDKTVLNEVEQKKIPSPKLSRILRRQKIHTEAVFSLDEIKMQTSQVDEQQHLQIDLVSEPSCNDGFRCYSDLYFKNNQTLNSYSVHLKDFVVNTEHNILLSKVLCNFTSAFVPFYQLKDSPVVLPKIRVQESRCDGADVNINLFNKYVPIFSCPFNNVYAKKISADDYSRVSLLDIKKKSTRNVNLDEIIPVMDDASSNVDDISHCEKGGIQEGNYNLQPRNEREVLLLNPLLLETVPRVKPRITQSEHKKIARITIMYTLAFFALALVTFFVIYLA